MKLNKSDLSEVGIKYVYNEGRLCCKDDNYRYLIFMCSLKKLHSSTLSNIGSISQQWSYFLLWNDTT